MKTDLNMFRKIHYLVPFITKANAAAITTINKKFVQNTLLQLLLNKKLKNPPPTPTAQNTATTTAIPKTINKKFLILCLFQNLFHLNKQIPIIIKLQKQ